MARRWPAHQRAYPRRRRRWQQILSAVRWRWPPVLVGRPAWHCRVLPMLPICLHSPLPRTWVWRWCLGERYLSSCGCLVLTVRYSPRKILAMPRLSGAPYSGAYLWALASNGTDALAHGVAVQVIVEVHNGGTG